MKARRIRTWEDLEALPKGKWVEVAGMDFQVVDETTRGSADRVVIPLNDGDAQRLKLRKGEVLEATVRGKNLELVRRRPKRTARP